MAIKKALPCVVIFIFLLLLLFVQSSSSSHIYPTNMARSRPIAKNIKVSRFGNVAASVGMVEGSAREVPTGPDPLHHNGYPIDP